MLTPLVFLALGACGGADKNDDTADTSVDYTARGPHAVGVARFVIDDPERPLEVEVWYPTDADGQGFPVEEYVADAADRERYVALLDAAPEGCPSTATGAIRDAAPAAPAEGAWPLLAFSHCYECVRFSSFSVAEHLASHGFVVAAPEHTGTTLFDALNKDILGLTDEALTLRLGDVSAALDAVLDGASGAPAVAVDPERVAVLGHSFGSITAAAALRDDDRLKAALGMAAPMEYPLLDSAVMDELSEPLLMLIAVEDNSISEAGNELMRINFDEAVGAAWKVEVEDAGHWSFSDICGLTDFVTPGCGEAARQTDPDETFSYIPVSQGIDIASAYSAAFFAETLRGEVGAVDAFDFSGVDVESR